MTGNAHTGALFTAASIVTLEVVESHFAAIAIFSLHVFLQERETEREIKKFSSVFIVPPGEI